MTARAEPAGPDAEAIDMLERLVATPMTEPLAREVVNWARIAMLSATIDRRPWGQALGLEGTPGRGDGRAAVRRRVRDRRLAELGQLLKPDASAAAKARAVLRVFERLDEVSILDVPDEDLPAARLLRQAANFAPIQSSEPRLAQAIRRGARIRESDVQVSNGADTPSDHCNDHHTQSSEGM